MLLVLGILVAVGLVQIAIWVPLVRRWRRRSAEQITAFQNEAVTTGERIVRGPEQGVYRGATGSYPAVKGNGTLFLTDRRIWVCRMTGSVAEVPLAKVVGTHRSPWFLGARVASRTHLVVETSDPAEVGFYVDDLDGWERDLSAGTTS